MAPNFELQDMIAPLKRTGRPALADCLTAEVKDFVRRKVIKTGSMALVYEWFVDDPACPEPLREYLLAKMREGKPLNLPRSLRRAANITPEAKAMYRGPRAYGHIGFKCRHNDRVIDPITGEERELMAGDIFISDDESSNFYFWYELTPDEAERRARNGDKLAEKFGVGIGRQTLKTIDARGKWLSTELIARARDSYTAADVLRHFRKVLAEYGMPRICWILEKGIWCATTIDGKRVVVMDECAREEVVAGLSSLGFIVEHVHTSEGKALIEGAFGNFQKAMDLMEVAPTIGRKRGEMEREAKLMRRIQDGVIHPAKGDLPHIDDLLAMQHKAQVFLNGREKFGRIQKGVPDDRWVQDTTTFPLKKLEPKHLGVFMPIKHETEIRQGCAEKKIGGITYRFSCPELFGVLGAKYRVLLAFDETDPAAGAEIYNLEAGRRNDQNYSPGEWIGHAEWEADRVLFGYTDEVGASVDRRKRYHKAFRTAYAGTGIFGKRALKASEARDGRGNVVTISQAHTPTGDQEQKPDRVETTAQRGTTPAARGSHLSPADGLNPRGGLSDADAAPGGRGTTSTRRKIKNRFELLEEVEK